MDNEASFRRLHDVDVAAVHIITKIPDGMSMRQLRKNELG